MKKFFKILIGLVIFLIFVGTLVFLYEKSREKPIVYQTATPFYTTIIKKIVATGSIVPRKEIDIKPQVSGLVEEIYVEAGKDVKRNDMLAKIKIIPNLVNLNEAESKVKIAQLNLKDANKSLARERALLEKGIISESQFQYYRNLHDSAKEELDASETNLQLLKEGISKKTNATTNTLIRSTIDGMILDVPIEEGDFVTQTNNFNDGTTIATVADMEKMIFKGNVDESEVGKLTLGMDLILTVGAIENQKFEATLEHISPKGSETQGAIQFKIQAKIKANPSHFLRAGYSAIADIVQDRRDNVLAISEGWMQFEDDNIFVEVETTPQIFEKRIIQVGLSDGLNIEVVRGLAETDKIKILNNPPSKN